MYLLRWHSYKNVIKITELQRWCNYEDDIATKIMMFENGVVWHGYKDDVGTRWCNYKDDKGTKTT